MKNRNHAIPLTGKESSKFQFHFLIKTLKLDIGMERINLKIIKVNANKSKPHFTDWEKAGKLVNWNMKFECWIFKLLVNIISEASVRTTEGWNTNDIKPRVEEDKIFIFRMTWFYKWKNLKFNQNKLLELLNPFSKFVGKNKYIRRDHFYTQIMILYKWKWSTTSTIVTPMWILCG